MKVLTVYLNNQNAGQLETDEDGSLCFTYNQDWLAGNDNMPLSRMLPLSPETYRGKKVRAFFAGILPEQSSRKRVAEVLGISETNDISLLERIGGECAGAVSLLPEGMQPDPVEYRLRMLNQKELEKVIHELPRRPLLAGEEDLRLSLAGAQEKLPVVIDSGSVSLPLGNTPSTHIIKPEPQRFPGLVANEAFCMRLAREVGLNVANVMPRTIGGTPCIIVSRYDRAHTHDTESTIRLHQEDFCQALGRPPENKYQQEGGPLVRECIDLLRKWSTMPVLDILAFIEGLIFNLLIGNADAHGKNYSILYQQDQRRLAPFYDLVSTIAWPELSTRPAMSIGNCKDVNDVNPDHFRAMAQQVDLGWPMVREKIAQFSSNLIRALENPALTNASFEPETIHHLAKIITDRCRKMLSHLNIP